MLIIMKLYLHAPLHSIKQLKELNIMKNSFKHFPGKSLLILSLIIAVFIFSSCDFSSSDSGVRLYSNDSIHNFAEVSPEYPGGNAAMGHFLRTNLQYPEKSLLEDAQGTVFISFVVEPNGKVTNINILRSVNEDLDQEAVRVIRKMPDWMPGIHEGNPVRVRLTLPVRFVLEPGE
jgi:TonB family protein